MLPLLRPWQLNETFLPFQSFSNGLGLRRKLADLGGLHCPRQVGLGPAETGGVGVGLVDSNSQVQTLLGASLELPGQLRAHHHLGSVHSPQQKNGLVQD